MESVIFALACPRRFATVGIGTPLLSSSLACIVGPEHGAVRVLLGTLFSQRVERSGRNDERRGFFDFVDFTRDQLSSVPEILRYS
jgi:hypothetical protein